MVGKFENINKTIVNHNKICNNFLGNNCPLGTMNLKTYAFHRGHIERFYTPNPLTLPTHPLRQLR